MYSAHLYSSTNNTLTEGHSFYKGFDHGLLKGARVVNYINLHLKSFGHSEFNKGQCANPVKQDKGFNIEMNTKTKLIGNGPMPLSFFVRVQNLLI